MYSMHFFSKLDQNLKSPESSQNLNLSIVSIQINAGYKYLSNSEEMRSFVSFYKILEGFW